MALCSYLDLADGVKGIAEARIGRGDLLDGIGGAVDRGGAGKGVDKVNVVM